MKNVAFLLVMLLVISSICLTSCGSKESNQSTSSKNVSSNSQSSNSEGNDNNQEDNNTGDGEYTYEPVDFEISASVNFLNGEDYGVFVDETANSSCNYGLVNTDGKVTIDSFDEVSSPKDGYVVCKDAEEKYSLYTVDGKMMIKPMYINMTTPSDGYVLCQKPNGNIVISTVTGKIVKEFNFSIKKGEMDTDDLLRHFKLEPFSEGLAFFSLDGMSLCVDTKGNDIFETELELKHPYVDGYAVFYERGENSEGYLVGLDTKGKEVWRKSIYYDHSGDLYFYDEGDIKNIILYKSSKNKMFGAIYTSGKEILPCKYDELSYPGNNKIGFKKYGLWGYMDYNGNEVIKPQFTYAKGFTGGVALVKTKDGDYGIINEDGDVQFTCDSDSMTYFDNGLILERGLRLLDSKGNVIYDADSSENDDARIYGGSGKVGINYFGGSIFYEWDRSDSPTSYKYFKLIKK